MNRRPPSVGVIDYGMGNRRSVQKALERGGAEAPITRDPAVLAGCQGLVLPGVGAFPLAMGNLSALGLDEFIRARVAAGVPMLGICLGMQLLFERSEELETTRGLGLLSGEVTGISSEQLRIPHIGWNQVSWERASALTTGLPAGGCPFYHVHSYAVRPADRSEVVGTTEYGERFATVVEQGRLFGVQFHPEKSSRHGLELISNFVRLCADGEAAGQQVSSAALSARG